MSAGGGTQDWFYHAPVKRSEHTAPIEYPAVSQIPGLNSLAQNIDDENGAKVGWIKDTDTKYIKLAKMGGRKGKWLHFLKFLTRLAYLHFVSYYSHCLFLSAMTLHNYLFFFSPRPSYLPDYMVYEEFNPARQPDNMHFPDKPRKPPYSLCDNLSAFKRDGDAVTDKTIKLPEIDRQYKKGVLFKVCKDTRRSEPRKGQQNQSGHQTGQNPSKEQVESFSKLLSMGYQDEWMKQRQKEFMNQQRTQENKKNKDSSLTKNKITTEYREVICKDQQNEKPTLQSVHKIRHTKASEARKQRDSEDNKELFKLNRFTKVGPKVNSHWQKTDDSYSRQLADVNI
ncbi:uncharacterized protein C7orf57 homolog [Anneissia japonica]|uniref:uncharacterized protein C7orf57 homolog n=1 Tax=Anneissia japonica TaxID=1529436 RepID=UPI001425B76C|nr:uncharacterized protein C7orf57 homolog [Anneissia japonica]